jgi:rubredoxin
MEKEQIYKEDIIPSDNLDYIETRFNDLRVRLVCNDCGYKFFSKRNYSFVDNLEGYDELIDGVRCPNCGSKDVEEI